MVLVFISRHSIVANQTAERFDHEHGPEYVYASAQLVIGLFDESAN
jgi:hypothetical protein